MFDFIDINQNTDEWLELRGGKLTSSKMNVIMANYGKSFGEPAKKYAVNIAIEQITGKCIRSSYTNEHMSRGHAQEPVANNLYQQETFSTTTNGGFFKSDFVGCSPDGLVGNDGVIEIKSVITNIHYANVKRQSIDPAYKWQCYGNLLFTGREWLDFISYCEDYPEGKQLFIHRINKNESQEQFKMIQSRIEQFKELVDSTKQSILTSRYDNY